MKCNLQEDYQTLESKFFLGALIQKILIGKLFDHNFAHYGSKSWTFKFLQKKLKWPILKLCWKEPLMILV